MTQPDASLTLGGPAASSDGQIPSAERLTRAFSDMRDELVSTLMYLLGNREDAQDAAQEAFVKCWRHQEKLAEIENMKAWIFRVALNAGRDIRETAWRRKRLISPITSCPTTAVWCWASTRCATG